MGMEVTTLSVQVKSDGIDQATKSLDNLGSQAERTEKAVDKLTNKLANTSSSFGAIKASLNELKAVMAISFPTEGANALNKAMAELSATLSSIKAKNIKIDVGAKDLGKDAEVARKGVESLNQSLASGQNVMQMFGKELYHIRNLLGGTMLAGALINTAQAAIGMADAWTLMGAKLKMQVGSAYAAADAQQKLYVMAQQLRVPLQGVTQLFTRLVPAMNEYGYSTKDAMSVTQAMAAALKVSGATAAEASSVILQFSQSMQAGRLNGAEFNAVAEGAPIILRLIGQEINKTRGDLKKMGADGVISVELITEVLKKNKDALTKMSSSVPDTVESAFTNLTNALTKYIGEANNAVGVTGLIAAAIKLLADNLEIVGNVAKYVAIAGFAAYSASLANAMIQMAVAPALSTSLAAEIGLVGVAATGAAGGVGLLDRALLFLAKNPIIVIFTLLATGAAYVYDKFQQAEEATKGFTNKLAELDKLKGAQALSAYSSAIDEVLANLSKENDKLTELEAKRKKAYKFSDIMAYNDAIEQQKKAVTTLAEQYGVLAQRQADVNSGEAVKRVSAKIKELQDEGKWLDYQISQGKKLKEIDKQIFDAEKEIATAKDGFFKDSLVANLKELKANKARVDMLDEIDKASKKAGKEEESMAKKLEKSYLSALNSAQAFLEGQQEELGLKRKLTDSEKEYEKVMRMVSDLKTKFRGADVSELENIANRIKKLGEEKRIREELNKFLDKEQELKLQAIALDAQFADSQFKATQALKERINLQQLAFMDVGQSPLGTQLDSQQNDKDRLDFLQQQINLTAELIDLQVQKAYWEAYMANDSAGMARAEKAGEELQKRIDGYQNEVRALKALLPLQDEYSKVLALTAKKNMLETGRTPGQILAEGFGEAGAAIAKMSEAYKTFGDDMAKVDKYVADQKKMLADKGQATPENLAKVEKEVADKRIQINAQMYGSLAGAAKGFFSENSKGYQAMAKAEKAFRALELALTIKNFVQKMFFTSAEITANKTKTASAIAGNTLEIASNWALAQVKAVLAFVTQGTGDPYTAFGRMAAMAAILAAVGLSISGASGGGSKNVAQDRQAAQGAGTVFGDTTAKSESITKSLDLIKENTKISAQYNVGMLSALQNIEAALTGAATAIIRQGVGPSSIDTKKGIAAFGIPPSSALGKAQSSFVEKSAKIDQVLKENFLPMLGGDALNKIFGLKTSVKDTGITSQAQTIADILSKGFSAQSYATIEEKARFRKPKQHDVTEDLPEETTKQFNLVIGSLATGIKEAGKALGVDSQAFNDRLNAFVVDIGTISLEGMSSDKIKETLTNVFSKLGDQMATAALADLADLDDFQKAGEGYFETLTRVATTVATVDGIFGQFGVTFDLTGIQAVAAKMKIAELAGGLEGLSSKITIFADHFMTESEKQANKTRIVTDEFKRLGVAMIDLNADDARIQFRDIVLSFKDGNQEVFNSLLNLEGVVNDLTPAFKKVATAAEIAEQKISLQDKINQLTMTSSEYLTTSRQKELEKMDQSLRPLQERINALEDEKQALALQDKINQLTMSKQDYLILTRQKELAAMDASLRPLQMRIYAIEDEKTALETLKTSANKAMSVLEKSVTAEKTALKKSLDDKIENINYAKDYENAAYDAAKASIEAKAEADSTYYDTQAKTLADQLDSVKEYRDNVKALFDDITGAMAKLLGGANKLKMSYQSGMAALDRAVIIAKTTGQLPEAKGFKDVLDAITSLDVKDFSSMFDYQRSQLVTTGKLQPLNEMAGAGASNAELAVKYAEQSVTNIKLLADDASKFYKDELKELDENHKGNIQRLDDQIKVLNKQYESDVEYLDSILTVAKGQLELADGTYIETKGVKEAVGSFAGALSAYILAKDAQTEAWVTQISNMAMSTVPTLTQIAERTSTENQQLKDELAGMREEAAAQSRAIAANTAKTAKVLSQWDGDGQPEVRNVA